MNALIQTHTLTMTSREIAELVEKRHDNVKRTIEMLAEKQVIRSPQIEETEEINNLGLPRTLSHYLFTGEQGKRDSIVIVAQLSPEFTARLVDRWQELENKVRKTGGNSVKRRVTSDEFARALKLTPLAVKAALATGCDKNAAIIHANQAIRKETGKDVLALLDRTHLKAENQSSLHYNATELGQQLGGLSAIKVNKLLEEAGLQSKAAGYWLPTPAGRAHAFISDTGKTHSNGAPIQQVRWFDSVLPLIEPEQPRLAA